MHDSIVMLAGRRFHRLGGLFLTGLLVSVSTGCLSLGGKTTYVQTSPETEARIAGLETRIGALEQAVTTRAVASPQFQPGGQVLSN